MRTLDAADNGCLYRNCRFNALRSRRGDRSTLVDKKFPHPLKHFVEFLSGHLSNRMKNDVLFDAEQSLRTDEARLRKLAAFKIAASQRNGESIGVRAAGDLAENQIFSWKISNHQSGPALSAIGSRKRNDNDFAGYRFDHAASSSGEFQSRPRTDSLNSAPLNALFSSESFEAFPLTLRESAISSPTLRILPSND